MIIKQLYHALIQVYWLVLYFVCLFPSSTILYQHQCHRHVLYQHHCHHDFRLSKILKTSKKWLAFQVRLLLALRTQTTSSTWKQNAQNIATATGTGMPVYQLPTVMIGDLQARTPPMLDAILGNVIPIELNPSTTRTCRRFSEREHHGVDNGLDRGRVNIIDVDSRLLVLTAVPSLHVLRLCCI